MPWMQNSLICSCLPKNFFFLKRPSDIIYALLKIHVYHAKKLDRSHSPNFLWYRRCWLLRSTGCHLGLLMRGKLRSKQKDRGEIGGVNSIGVEGRKQWGDRSSFPPSYFSGVSCSSNHNTWLVAGTTELIRALKKVTFIMSWLRPKWLRFQRNFLENVLI